MQEWMHCAYCGKRQAYSRKRTSDWFCYACKKTFTGVTTNGNKESTEKTSQETSTEKEVSATAE